jgi:hypothetical protein
MLIITGNWTPYNEYLPTPPFRMLMAAPTFIFPRMGCFYTLPIAGWRRIPSPSFPSTKHSGLLTTVGHTSTYGDHPRNFTIDPTGNFLLVANQVTNNIVVFKRDLLSGLLTKMEQEIMVPNPSCLQMRAYGN